MYIKQRRQTIGHVVNKARRSQDHTARSARVSVQDALVQAPVSAKTTGNRKTSAYFLSDALMRKQCKALIGRKQPDPQWLTDTGLRLRSGKKIENPESRNTRWMRLFKAFLAFKAKHDHVHIPRACKEHVELGQWVHAQRQLAKQGTLAPVKCEILTAAGFKWQVISDDPEMTHLAELLAFHKEHGHVAIYEVYDHDHHLGKFIYKSRSKYLKKTLRKEIVDQLNAINFPWDPQVARWEEWFSLLVQYKKENGSAYIPQTVIAKKDHPLKSMAIWIATQRSKSKSGRLTERQDTMLRELGAFDTAQDLAEQKKQIALQRQTLHAESPVYLRKLEKPQARTVTKLTTAPQLLTPEEVWENLRLQTQAFKACHGRFPMREFDEYDQKVTNEIDLAIWLEETRLAYRTQRLTADQMERLERTGLIPKEGTFRLRAQGNSTEDFIKQPLRAK